MLINVRDGKIIAEQIIGLMGPDEYEYYKTFVVNKDLTISVFKIKRKTNAKKLVETFRITANGAIVLEK